MSDISAQKEIEGDWMRLPRSHENMVVFTFGARKAQELPFVLGVMSDLSGKSKVPVKPVDQRGFLEFRDTENLGERMAAMRPRANYSVPNPLKEGEMIPVDLEFESMDDFKPDRVAKKVAPEAFEMRERLANLRRQLDGPNAAQAEKVFNDLVEKLQALQKGK
jgi:type VI secretion system protein ImpB